MNLKTIKAAAEQALTAVAAYALGHVSADQVSEHIGWLSPDARVAFTAAVALVLTSLKAIVAKHTGNPTQPLFTDLHDEATQAVAAGKVVLAAEYPEIVAALRNFATEYEQKIAAGAKLGPVTITATATKS